jgi:hypothetical protein
MIAAIILQLLATGPNVATAESFAGWQTMRVIEQDGYPWRWTVANLDEVDGDELIVVNTRQSRLEIYRWTDPGQADAQEPTTPIDPRFVRVNDLPMAPEVELTEVAISQLPHDVLVHDLDADGQPELYVLVTDPNRLVRYSQDNEKGWSMDQHWELRAGQLTAADDLLLAVEQSKQESEGRLTLWVSYQEGVQSVELAALDSGKLTAEVGWVQPRETINRNDWWRLDLDGDGQRDIVEWTSDANRSLRWYRGTADGYRPPQILHDRPIAMAIGLARNDVAGELLVLESNPAGVVRRFELSQGEEEPLGRRDPLPLPGGDNAIWASLTIQPTKDEVRSFLAVVDDDQPRLSLFELTDEGWQPGESYPIVADVERIMGRASTSGELLLWSKEAADLVVSRWADGRMSYPQAMGLGGEAEDRMILGMGQIGKVDWVTQKVDNDLVLYKWTESGVEPTVEVVFTDQANKAEQAIWIGGSRLLVQDKFARGLRLVSLDAKDGGKSTQPGHLAKAALHEFRLFHIGTSEPPRLGRFTDGVLQWLDEELRATDQVMLDDDRRLADLVLESPTKGWALQQGGGEIHRLAADVESVSPVLNIDASYRVEGGRKLRLDPRLSLLMTTPTGLTRLAPGQPLSLEAVQSIDARSGRPAGVSEATVHRVLSVDIEGDGQTEAILADDLRHQLTVMYRDKDGKLIPMISWPVFEDETYPYGGVSEQQTREPRRIADLDFDGDGHRDLAMLSQDRLIFYLARDSKRDATNLLTEESQQ